MPDPILPGAPEVPPPPDPHLLTLHQTIGGLLQQRDMLSAHADSLDRLLKRARFNARPIDLGPAVVESLAVLTRSVAGVEHTLAIVLSELLALRGMDPGMKFTVEKRESPAAPPENGDRPARPTLVMP